MARKISMAALFVVLAATLLQSTFATNYTVGDTTGWTTLISSTEFYDNWVENKNFVVGDILVFNFTTGRHDVAEVSKGAYDSCTNNTIPNEMGPVRITLNTIGEHYFICTFTGHCLAGQKLKVEVGNGNSTTPTPGSSPNSASSLVATLSLVFMSIVLVLLCH